MLTNFWEGLGGQEKLTRLIATVLLPSLIFWLGGLVVWLVSGGIDQVPVRINDLDRAYNQLSTSAQTALLAGGLALVILSAAVVERTYLPCLRLLEGYWPGVLDIFKRFRLSGFKKRYKKKYEHRDQLKERDYLASRPSVSQPTSQPAVKALTSKEQATLLELDIFLSLYPQFDTAMPTKLGNVLQFAERQSKERYGLDSIICWPRLWLVLPEGVKGDLSESRSNLNMAVRIFCWGVLFMVWAPWWPPSSLWVLLLGILIALFAYNWAIGAARTYGDLLMATFDTHRVLLYRALNWPLPKDSQSEKEYGERLTQSLFRGPSMHQTIVYDYEQDAKTSSTP